MKSPIRQFLDKLPLVGAVALIAWGIDSAWHRQFAQEMNDRDIQGQGVAVQIKSVSDGDTFTTGDGDRIRLCGIDAPEKSQPLGPESGNKLRSLLSSGQVMVSEIEKDRYGRTVAEVFVVSSTEISVQEEMLKSGNAYLYRQYLANCPNARSFEDAEAIGRSQNVGIWSRSDLVKPWEYRQKNRDRSRS